MNHLSYIYDKKRKREIRAKVLKSHPFARYSRILLPLFFLAFGAGMLLFGLQSANAFLIIDPGRSNFGEKDYFSLGLAVAMSQLLLWVFYLCFWIILDKIYGKNLTDRINESIAIQDGEIIYGYQNRIGSTAADRVIVTISLDRLEKMEFEEEYSRMIFTGPMNSTYYENYLSAPKRAERKPNITSFVLYDCYSPSVLRDLKNIRDAHKEIKHE